MSGPTIAGQVALVTGASRGIGRGIAQELAARGLKVTGTATTEAGARAIGEALASCGGRGIVLDVNDAAAVDAAVDTIVKADGALHVVVNNAGITRDGLSMRMKDDDWDAVVDTNLKAVFRVSRAAIRPMMKQRYGRIVNITSVVGATGNPGQANYAAAKAGVEAFSNSLRAEVAHLGVKVGVAHPTWIRTDLVESADAHPVFGKLRASMPGLIGKTYPLDTALDDLEAGILKRARTIHVPRWVGGLKLLRAFLPPIIEIGSRSRVPSADKAALADIEARGAFESAVTGHGGRAATTKS